MGGFCLLSNLGANCLLPMQKENSGPRNFLLAIVCKRPVSPQSGHQPFHERNLMIYTKTPYKVGHSSSIGKSMLDVSSLNSVPVVVVS